MVSSLPELLITSATSPKGRKTKATKKNQRNNPNHKRNPFEKLISIGRHLKTAMVRSFANRLEQEPEKPNNHRLYRLRRQIAKLILLAFSPKIVRAAASPRSNVDTRQIHFFFSEELLSRRVVQNQTTCESTEIEHIAGSRTVPMASKSLSDGLDMIHSESSLLVISAHNPVQTAIVTELMVTPTSSSVQKSNSAVLPISTQPLTQVLFSMKTEMHDQATDATTFPAHSVEDAVTDIHDGGATTNPEMMSNIREVQDNESLFCDSKKNESATVSKAVHLPAPDSAIDMGLKVASEVMILGGISLILAFYQ